MQNNAEMAERQSAELESADRSQTTKPRKTKYFNAAKLLVIGLFTALAVFLVARPVRSFVIIHLAFVI